MADHILRDIATVMWKERKGLFRLRGRPTKYFLNLLTPFVLAIMQPLRDFPEWVAQQDSVVLAAISAMLLVFITVPDSFAGERERHTLGTLLACRIPDRAILFGKLAACVAFAWGATVFVLVVGLVTANVAHWEGEILFFSPTIAVADLALSFLVATLCAGAGVLISLRSITVQEATQTLTTVFVMPPILLLAVLMTLREGFNIIERVSGEQALFAVIAILAIIDLAIFAIVMVRFRRSRLMLYSD